MLRGKCVCLRISLFEDIAVRLRCGNPVRGLTEVVSCLIGVCGLNLMMANVSFVFLTFHVLLVKNALVSNQIIVGLIAAGMTIKMHTELNFCSFF